MYKKFLLFLLLIFATIFGINAYAKDDMPIVVINDTEVDTSDGFILNSDTVFVSPEILADLFNMTLSSDEYNVVHTFSNSVRSVTYDVNTGSVNISDRRSFAFKVIDSAYPSYTYAGKSYIPLRMFCNSFDIDIDYMPEINAVAVKDKGYYNGLYNSDGVAVAKKGNLYGIVNAAGDVLLPFEYDDISNYDNPTMFRIVDNHRCGIASENGKLVTEIIYNDIEYVSAGEIYLYIGDDKGMCNIDGRIIVPVKYDDIAYSGNNIAMVKSGNKWSLLNCNTGIPGDTYYDEVYEITAGIQTDNYMIKGYYANKNGKWGCVDSFGETVIEFKYDALDKFDEMGRARVIYDGKFGIIDCGGQVIIPTAYDYIYPFGILRVTVAEVGGKYGAINLDGTVAIPFEYDYIYSFNNSFTTVAYKDKLFSVISIDGENVSGKTYRYIEEFKNGIALAYSDGYGYIDHSGNEIIDCIHSDVKQGTALSVFLKKDGKWALFSPNGENLSGFVYGDAGGFENGLSAVSKEIDGKLMYGYVNDSNDIVIPFIYTAAQQFKYGKAIVSQNGKSGIIDIEGGTVIPFEYTGFNPSYDYNVIAAAENGSKWGLISFKNERLTEFSYDYIFEFEDGYATVLKDHSYGVINTNGNLVVDVKYKSSEEAMLHIK